MKNTSTQQLVLGVQLSHSPRLDNFVCTEQNKALLNLLEQFFKPAHPDQSIVTQARHIYLHGQAAAGKTHLLKSMVAAAQDAQLSAEYISLREHIDKPATLLKSLSDSDVVCIDDLEEASKSSQWQQQLFHWYNFQQERGGYMFFTAQDVPDALDLSLKDLVSRLNWGLTYRINALDDTGLHALFKKHAQLRGIRLDTEVIDYIMLRTQRSTRVLMDIIEKLDQASWQTQRAITKPFVKEILRW